MRLIVALAGALLITIVVFLFMQSLIESRRQASNQLPVHGPVEVVEAKNRPEEPDNPEPVEEMPELVMDELQLPVLAPEPTVELEFPSLDLAVGDFELGPSGDRWGQPLASNAAGVLKGQGVGAQGYVEVVPIGTRVPNVPELAWQNRINGWVLVAFNVTPAGRTANIRVLDASPRGVFEETVVAAVEDWLYSVTYFGKLEGNIVLTQKVGVEWKNYPNNYLNLDR